MLFRRLSALCGISLFLVFMLAGCASGPTQLGVSPGEWKRYTSDQQQQMVYNLHKIEAMQSDKPAVLGKNKLRVKVSSGTMLMEPMQAALAFKPFAFTIQQGLCINKNVKAVINSDAETVLTACYKDDTLYLDPSRYDVDKAYGTITLHSSPLWSDGFTYHGLKSSGYVRMHKVKVRVKLIEG